MDYFTRKFSTNEGIPLDSVEITTIKQLPIGRSRMESVEK